MAEWHDWLAWYRKCALAACDAPTREALQRFALARWQRYATVCAGATNCEAAAITLPSAAVAWHDFETALRLRSTRRGKAYKHWLFTRLPACSGKQTSLDAIQGGATLIMRDVVRERFRREMSRRGTLSMNAPLPGAPAEAPSLQELLPSPEHTLEHVQQRELAAWGAALAAELCRRILSRRAKIALLAREAGVSVAHPAVLAAAACGKSQLYAAYHEALQTIAETVNKRFEGDDRATRASLAVATLQALQAQLLAWAKSEKCMAEFF